MTARPLSRSIRRRLDAGAAPPVVAATLHRTTAAVVVFAVMTAVSLTTLGIDLPNRAHLMWAPVVATACVAAELAVNDAARYSRRGALRPTDALVAACLVWQPGTYLLVSLALSTVATGVLWRREPLRIQWATARDTAALAAGLLVASQLHDDTVTRAVVTMGIAAAVIAASFTLERFVAMSPLATVPGTGSTSLFFFGVGTSVGITAGAIVPHHPATIVLFILPCAAILQTYGGRRVQVEERALLDDLLTFARSLPEEESLEAAARTLQYGAEAAIRSAAMSAIVTVFEPGAGLRVERGVGGDVVVRRSLAHTGAHEAVHALGGAPHVLHVGPHGGSFTALLGPADNPVGMLEVSWAKRTRWFRKPQMHLGLLLVELGGQWVEAALVRHREYASLQRAAASDNLRAASILHAELAPALAALDRATQGLTYLTDGDGIDIGDELDAAAQALAALAGAAAQAIPGAATPADRARMATARSDAQTPPVLLGQLPLGPAR